MNNDIDNPNSEYWKQKYLKYKAKYMNLNNTTGGSHRSHRRNNSYSQQQFSPFMQQPGFNSFFQQPVAIGPNGVMTSGLMGPGMVGPGMVGGPGGLMVGPSGIMSPGGIIQPGLSSPGFIMTPRGLVPFFKMNTTPVTPVTTDVIYKTFGEFMKSTNCIYLNLQNMANNVLVKSVETTKWLKIQITIGSTDYIKQMKTGLDTLLGSVITETDIGDKMKYGLKDGRVSFNIKTSNTPPVGYEFVVETNVIIY